MTDRASVPEHIAGAVLTIDLDALRSNYRRILQQLNGVPSAAVVKADGYGLGIGPVGRTLWDAGARTFFVAHPVEGIALRGHLPDAEIVILGGALSGMEGDFRVHRLIPALNDLGGVDRWRTYCGKTGENLPAVLHVDTGMCRLGLDRAEFAKVQADPSLLGGIDITIVMSHLASADEPASLQSAAQLAYFKQIRQALAPHLLDTCRASFAASSAIFLGPDYHFDLGRPGVALYGVNPTPGKPNPMTQVIRLQAKILQVRAVDTPETVGYGATHRVGRPSRIATLPVGYADGYLRSLSNRAKAYIGDREVPLVGRVSMDLITLDVTGVPAAECRPGALVDLISPNRDVDAVAADAGTIGYELLTSLGRRYHRHYIGGGS
ncbi:MAG: alanine racemase [Rhodospirillaceae bacterium]